MELREVIQRLRKGQGIRRIHGETGIHRTILRELRVVAEDHGWLEPEAPIPSEQDIQQVRGQGGTGPQGPHPLEAYREEIAGWVQAGHSYVVMHQLIRNRHPCSEATLRRFVQKHFPKRPRVSVARPTMAGEDWEVDFGYLGLTYDPDTRRDRKTWLFSGRLRHSRLAWREAVFDQKAPTFFLAHMHAFEYFGGVPSTAIPDNLKAAVLKASWQEPLVNRAYRQLAEYYGFLISACPPRKPRLKDHASDCTSWRGCAASFAQTRRSRKRFPGWAMGSGPWGGSQRIWPRSSARTARSTPSRAKRFAVEA
jgi:hypothetical protein